MVSDKFWEHEPWNWPRAIAATAMWLAIAAIVCTWIVVKS